VALPAAELVVAGVYHDAQQPGLEGAAPKFSQRPEGRQEGVLHGVAGLLGAAECAVRYVVGQALIKLYQQVKGVNVAATGSLDAGLLFEGRSGHGVQRRLSRGA
jgi:hypothetical protein